MSLPQLNAPKRYKPVSVSPPEQIPGLLKAGYSPATIYTSIAERLGESTPIRDDWRGIWIRAGTFAFRHPNGSPVIGDAPKEFLELIKPDATLNSAGGLVLPDGMYEAARTDSKNLVLAAEETARYTGKDIPKGSDVGPLWKWAAKEGEPEYTAAVQAHKNQGFLGGWYLADAPEDAPAGWLLDLKYFVSRSRVVGDNHLGIDYGLLVGDSAGGAVAKKVDATRLSDDDIGRLVDKLAPALAEKLKKQEE